MAAEALPPCLAADKHLYIRLILRYAWDARRLSCSGARIWTSLEVWIFLRSSQNDRSDSDRASNTIRPPDSEGPGREQGRGHALGPTLQAACRLFYEADACLVMGGIHQQRQQRFDLAARDNRGGPRGRPKAWSSKSPAGGPQRTHAQDAPFCTNLLPGCVRCQIRPKWWN